MRRVGDQQWSVDGAGSLQFPPMRTITGLDELKRAEGEELGVSDWHQVTQKDIDAFAEATGDHQWIHVDPERAKETPFGGTIAHGYYTLSLAPKLNDEIFEMDGFVMAINYGLNKVRFPAPVPVDSRIRMRAKLAELEDIPGGAQMVMELTFEREGGDKPVCVAQSVVRVYEG
jgi:acyl dehydratase